MELHTRALFIGTIYLAIFITRSIATANVTEENGYTLYAPFNMKGMIGNITFFQENKDENVTITVNLELIPNFEEEISDEQQKFRWAIHSYPMIYDAKDLCQRDDIGNSIHKLNSKHGEITLPTNESLIEFQDTDLKLVGEKTIWGRSILLTSPGGVKYCANIMTLHPVKTAKARLFSPVGGEIIIRENQFGDSTIFTNIFTVSDKLRPSLYPWRILISDILDRESTASGGQGFCEYLNSVYNPHRVDGANCSESNQKECIVGQLTGKHGGIKVGSSNNQYSRRFFVDTNLPIIDLEGYQSLYLVLYENNEDIRIMTCGQIAILKPKDHIAYFSNEGVNGYVRFIQDSPYDPTIISVNLSDLKGRAGGYHIHEYPRPYKIFPDQKMCTADAVGGHFNPFNIDKSKSPPNGYGTPDQYEVGDLSGKFGELEGDGMNEYFVDFNLALFGKHSVVGRALTIHKPNGDRWICSNIEYQDDITTAVATFHYPVVGQVIFRQEKDNPFAETYVFAELSYNDGTRNNTDRHRWGLHVSRPNNDFLGWKDRCVSVNGAYNPHGVSNGSTYRYCNNDNIVRCSAGDLTSKLGRIGIAARKGSMKNKVMKTDMNLALAGVFNIIGRSIVIYDDKAPSHRGNRLACAPIFVEHPIKAQVKKWSSGVGVASKVNGVITLYQNSRYDPTLVNIEMEGLEGQARGYHIHRWPVPDNLEFPCTGDAVSGHFNPFNVSLASVPPPATGSFDHYENGDLSGKYGTMDNKNKYSSQTIDPTISLRGPNSVFGRSVVIHKAARNFRWVCGNFEPDTEIGFPRKIIAIASFDQLEGFVRGYVRLTQLVYPNGGSSDTTVEVNLRYPGKNNRNVTTGHKWSVFYEQVRADAVIKSEKSRCLASVHVHDPYRVYTANEEAYDADCNIYNPFRCRIGDLSKRHGSISVGVEQRVFSDMNLPLYGNGSVIYRSVVIHSKNGSPNKLGCANIIEDRHLVYKVTIRKPQSFGSQDFMNAVREALDTFDWLVYAEAHTQNQVNDGDCVELTVHFRGSNAYRLLEEFKTLMNTGEIRKHTRLGVKHRKIRYRLCSQDQNSAHDYEMPNVILFVIPLSIQLFFKRFHLLFYS